MKICFMWFYERHNLSHHEESNPSKVCKKKEG